jgi:hypothetical protein
MSKMRLVTEYALMARCLVRDFSDPRARVSARAKARVLPRIEDGEAGFLKARIASFLRTMVLNCDQVPETGATDYCECLRAGANLLLLLPDAPAAPAPDGGPPRTPRYNPGRD